ncbi:family 78 glycoside hydrolase catalytic domain [Thermopirellula anaerolimosa]
MPRSIKILIAVMVGLCMGTWLGGTRVFSEESGGGAKSSARVEQLRCEYRVNPLGIDVVKPRLSWIMVDARRGARQTAYQILAASSSEKLARDEGDLWDSGRVESSLTNQIEYGGRPLNSRMECHWKVRIWDADGAVTDYSPPAVWTMGLLEDADREAQWIQAPAALYHPVMEHAAPQDDPAKKILATGLFRKEFNVDQPVRKATLYASALGLFDVELNGTDAVADLFPPGWTDYNKRVYYNTYDVTSLVGPGKNAIGATLAPGWYSGHIGWFKQAFLYGKDPKIWLQLELEMADGSRRIVATDDSWKFSFGPELEAEFLAGETYDARLRMPGWSEPNFDDGNWKPAVVASDVVATLEAQPGVPVLITGEVPTQSITEPYPGVFVFDLGQNFAGFARLRVQGPAGTRVQMRFAEVLNPDGTIYTTNLRSARATDTYILSGDGVEVWQPRFTFHGFRYVEVTGYPGRPEKDAVTGLAVNSDIPMVGSFTCSNPMVNQLFRNIVWTQRANFISVPTDCPQRDERLGWTGDAEVFIRAASYNADVAAFFTKWLRDLEDAQGPEGDFPDVAPRIVAMGGGTAAWADAGTICPWTIHHVYADRRVLEELLDAMERWIAYCRTHSQGLLRPAQGYGDWLSINADTPKDVLATAFFAYSTRLTAEAAEALGMKDKAAEYLRLYEDIRRAFQAAYVSDDGRVKGDTQTCYVLALRFGLLPEDLREKAARHLVDDIAKRDHHLSTGFVGTAFLMPTLSDFGHTGTAYHLLLNDTFPSWGFSIKHGATSIWERWDGWTPEKGFQDPGMNSFAHYAFGAVGQWLFQYVAGIDTDGPGFRRIVLRPHLGQGLDFVNARYRSICGEIVSEWRKDANGLSWHVVVPANVAATICVPAAGTDVITVDGQSIENASGVRVVRQEADYRVLSAGAGEYQFQVRRGP